MQWEESLPFTPPSWTRTVVSLPYPVQAKRALLRRAFIDWLLRSSACRFDQRPDSHSLRARLSAVAMQLAMVWELPPGLAHVLHVVALYTAWSDREAEAELVSSSAFPSAPFSIGNAGANLFHLLAGRICFLNEQMSGRLLARASKSLREMLACLWEVGLTPSFILSSAVTYSSSYLPVLFVCIAPVKGPVGSGCGVAGRRTNCGGAGVERQEACGLPCAPSSPKIKSTCHDGGAW